jgi:hypothetical protein
MIRRSVLAAAFLVQVSAVMALDIRTTVDSRLQEPGVCWEPDVEFPVPCDDDDD